jgi:hypothetical protein
MGNSCLACPGTYEDFDYIDYATNSLSGPGLHLKRGARRLAQAQVPTVLPISGRVSGKATECTISGIMY